jgi:hypothetical protein
MKGSAKKTRIINRKRYLKKTPMSRGELQILGFFNRDWW